MARPRVDVVVPFRGEPGALRALRDRLGALALRPGDSLLVLDNTPGAPPAEPGPVRVLRDASIGTPGFARNRGAAAGDGPWIVFIDADTEPVADLLDRFFEPSPEAATVLLAGGVLDEPVAADGPAAARFAHLRGTLHQDRALTGRGRFAFAQAANIAVRRSAFAAAGGFREDIRAGEDADLSFRVAAAGGGIERRDAARVIHRSRRSISGLIAQAALHGAGAAWVERRYPGAFPARRRPGLVWWGVRTAAAGCARYLRGRERDVLVLSLLEPLWVLAFEFGRSRSVEVPVDAGADGRR